MHTCQCIRASTELGSLSVVSFESKNSLLPMCVTNKADRSSDASFDLRKAKSPMYVTESGSLREVKIECSKAWLSILFTAGLLESFSRTPMLVEFEAGRKTVVPSNTSHTHRSSSYTKAPISKRTLQVRRSGGASLIIPGSSSYSDRK